MLAAVGRAGTIGNRLIQLIQFHRLPLDQDLLTIRRLPARHLRECVFMGTALLTGVEFGVLRRLSRPRAGVRWAHWAEIHGFLRLVPMCRRMVGWNVGFVEILVLSSSRCVAAAAAIAAALETVAALAAAGKSTARAADYTPNDRNEDQAADHDERDSWPSAESVSTRNAEEYEGSTYLQ